MKKYVLDMRVVGAERPHEGYVLLRLTSDGVLPAMRPGQFVEVRVDGSPATFLRRPISIHNVSVADNELWLLIRRAGQGTERLTQLRAGDTLNVVLPLGRGFTMPQNAGERVLLVGGGVGVAPLLYMGAEMARMGCRPTFLLGARSAKDLLQVDLFQHYGPVYVTTEDGTAGERGFVTQHSVLRAQTFDRVACCGPKPMMVAVARYARAEGIACEVSLENMMACGLGACLCCVEATTKGHVCVCKDGPVFNIDDLLWQI